MEQLGAPIRSAMRACKAHFLAAGVFSGLLNVLYLAPTLYMLQVYDRVVPSRGSVTLAMLTLALVLALATLALLDMVRSRLLVRAGKWPSAAALPRNCQGGRTAGPGGLAAGPLLAVARLPLAAQWLRR